MNNEKLSVIVIVYRDFGPVYRMNLEDFARTGRELDCRIVVIALEGTSLSKKEADFIYPINSLDDVNMLLREVEKIDSLYKIHALIPAFEGEVFPCSVIREKLGIPGLRAEEGALFRNKNAMATRAKECGVKTAPFIIPHTKQLLYDFIQKVGFPVILKPYDGMACMKTYKVNNELEMEAVWNEVRDKRESMRVEEYIDGIQFHVDSIVHDNEVIFRVISRYTAKLLDPQSDLGQIAVGSLVVDEATVENTLYLQEINDTNERIVEGFGLENGITHAEFFVTNTGVVYLGEIGARLPGAYIVPMIREGFGVSMASEWVRTEMQLNYKGPLVCKAKNRTIGFLLKTRKTGLLTSTPTQEQLALLPGVSFALALKAIGDYIPPAQMSCDSYAFLVCSGSNEDEVLTRFQRYAEELVYEVFDFSCLDKRLVIEKMLREYVQKFGYPRSSATPEKNGQ